MIDTLHAENIHTMISVWPKFDPGSTNYDQLKVQLYAVTPADYDAFLLALRTQWNRDHPTPLPGLRRVRKTNASANRGSGFQPDGSGGILPPVHSWNVWRVWREQGASCRVSMTSVSNPNALSNCNYSQQAELTRRPRWVRSPAFRRLRP